MAAEKFINYLVKNWLTEELWQSWSQFGRLKAAKITGVPLKGIAPTTNHLEAFNGVLKKKYIRGYQHKGYRIRFDLLIHLLVTRIIPSIYARRKATREYFTWLSQRFEKEAGGANLVSSHCRLPLEPTPVVTWWIKESDLRAETILEIKFIVSKGRIAHVKWKDPFTITATCASSLAHTNIEGHRRFHMELNCYGLASCLCPFNQNGKGACKHLWAFRLLLPQFHPTFIFYFPSNQSEAIGIFNHFKSLEAQGKGNNIEPPPNCQLSEAATDVNAIIEEARIDMGPSSSSEAENSSNTDDSSDLGATEESPTMPLLPSFVYTSSSSEAALRQQRQNKLDQKLSFILPHLHDLHLLLKDFDHVPTKAEFTELDSIITQIRSQTSRLLLNEMKVGLLAIYFHHDFTVLLLC